MVVHCSTACDEMELDATMGIGERPFQSRFYNDNFHEQMKRERAVDVPVCSSSALAAPQRCRYFFSIFQKNGTGETTTPLRLERQAIGWNHWP